MPKFFADNGKYVFVGQFVFTRAEFTRLVPEYTLPPGYTGREYTGSQHRLWKINTATVAEQPWPLGEWIVANAGLLRRRAEEPTSATRCTR